MKTIEVLDQAQLDCVPDDFEGLIIIKGNVSLSRVWESAHVVAREFAHVVARGSAHVVARESAHVVAWESAHVVARESAHVEAWESAHVVARESAHVEAGESAHVEAGESAHVVAWESAHVVAWGFAHVVAREFAHVVARGSAHVVAWESAHVVAWESAHVVAWGFAHVVAGKWASVRKTIGHSGIITGGIVIVDPEITSADEWCAYHGVTVQDGVAILYKAVRDDYRSWHGSLYTPGSSPVCTDWDGGIAECGGGLHFSATITEACAFDDEATRYLACPVAIADMRAPKIDDGYPGKIKASRICGPIVEVSRDGKPARKEGAAS
jgi:hypothetical protein